MSQNAPLPPDETACPSCGERILAAAKKCKHCGEWISGAPPLEGAHATFVAMPMTFGEAIAACLAKYATFGGRARRSEYFYFGLATSVVSLVALGAGTALFDLESGLVLYYIVLFGLALPSTACLVRRLHDTNRSGWWYWIALTGIGAIPLFIWVCTKGTPGDNNYGKRTT